MDTALIGQILAGLFFVAILIILMLGYMVAFALGGISLMFGVIGWYLGVFDPALFASLATRFFGVITDPVLISVPLFVYMGVVLEKSRIAEVLLTTMAQLFGSLRGGLGFSVVIVGTLLAAATGVVGATVVTMGLLSLPAMMRAGYDPKLATGVICAAGTLAQIIPPSTVLIFTAEFLQTANAAAQMEMGNFAPDTVSVGDLFAGAFIPGIALAVAYGLWVAWKAVTDPASCPAVPMSAEERQGLWRRAFVALVPPMTLIVAVLGSIIAGVATPTESASVGSLGALVLMMVKMFADRHLDDGSASSAGLERRLLAFWLIFIAMLGVVGYIWGSFGLLTLLVIGVAVGALTMLADGSLRPGFLATIVATNTSVMSITAMIFVILLGATAFALVFTRIGGGELVESMLTAMPGGATGALFTVMLIMFILGFFLDTFEIIFIMVPITAPTLLMMGVDPILLGVLIGVNLQTSFLTPPFGFSMFYLRGVTPPSITTGMIYKGTIPFTVIQVIAIVAVYMFPQSATWLPNTLFRSQPAAVEAPAAGGGFQIEGGAPESDGGGAFDLDGGAPETDGGGAAPAPSGGAFDLDGGGAPESDGQQQGGAFSLD